MKLIWSFLNRVISAVITPFRRGAVRLLRVFNLNFLFTRLLQPIRRVVRKLITLRPQSKEDYFVVGRWWIYKKLLMLVVLLACVCVFLYFNLTGAAVPPPVSPVAVKTSVTYDYDDMKAREYTGVANIRAADGAVVYTGELEAGVCAGNGTLWDRKQRLLYEGEFAANRYNGAGTLYFPSGAKRYEGSFANNLFEGEGRLYGEEGALLYEGGFSAGAFSGQGRQYDAAGGSLVYEGGFTEGRYHGPGTGYYADGSIRYTGEYFEGKPQGTGAFYDALGRKLYTGKTYAGEIDYRSLIGMNLADVEAAFAQTPRVFYTDSDCVFVFEQAGVVLTTNCRVRVHVWEKEEDAGSGGGHSGAPVDSPLYYLPTRLSTGGERRTVQAFVAAMSAQPNPFADEQPDPFADEEADQFVDDEEQPDPFLDERPGPFIADGETSSAPETEEIPASSDVPDFIDKDITLYYEIDKNIWRSERDPDWQEEKKKVLVRKVTVFAPSQLTPPADAAEIEDTLPPTLEDCVCIDYIRQEQPTAFGGVHFEMNKQNKLFVSLRGMNLADSIERTCYSSGPLIYRFCDQGGEGEAPSYFSIEKQ